MTRKTSTLTSSGEITGTPSAEVFRFVVPGDPVAKPRMTRSDKWKQRPAVLKYRAWADAARLAAGSLPPAECIAELCCVAYFAPPPSWSRRSQEAAIRKLVKHRSRPDSDNIGKAVLDSLFSEDSAISDVSFKKRWGWVPRVEVTIYLEPGA